MRQTAPRRTPEKIAVTTSGNLSVGAGDHLDLGMTVSVYCAGSASPPAEGAKDGESGTIADDSGACFTEH